MNYLYHLSNPLDLRSFPLKQEYVISVSVNKGEIECDLTSNKYPLTSDLSQIEDSHLVHRRWIDLY